MDWFRLRMPMNFGRRRLNLCLWLVRGNLNVMCLRFMSLNNVMVRLVLMRSSRLSNMVNWRMLRHLFGLKLSIRMALRGLLYLKFMLFTGLHLHL